MIQNQKMYGQMRPTQSEPIEPTDQPVQVNCSKCDNLFDLKKTHHEIFVANTLLSTNEQGFLAPTSQTHAYYRLCSGCLGKLKAWINDRRTDKE